MSSLTFYGTSQRHGIQVNGAEAVNRIHDNLESTIQVKMWSEETAQYDMDDLNIILTRKEAFVLAQHIIAQLYEGK
jgi:hypothetical protein